MKEFFQLPETKRIINSFKASLPHPDETKEFSNIRVKSLDYMLGSMLAAAQDWDKHCQINISWIASSFLNTLSIDKTAITKEDLIDRTYAICFRFLIELYLSIQNDLSMELEQAKQFTLENLANFNGEAQAQISFALNQMPLSLFKAVSTGPEITSIKDHVRMAAEADKKRKEWEDDLSGREDRVTALKDKLTQYETEFNFVGLYAGFKGLLKNKSDEKETIFKWLIVFGFLVVAPIFAELSFLYINRSEISTNPFIYSVSVIPMISLLIIFIYYFRLLNFNYKAVKSQLLQIELRMTLCQFIQSYADYSKEIKEKDKDVLTKFENIIFSGLVSDESKMPSTFDGLEQLSAFIKSLK
jgi:ABC-type multidrug transport system fused ATPase/permease subunit